MRSNRLGYIVVALVASSIAAFLVMWSVTGRATERVLAQGDREQSEETVNRLLVLNTAGSASRPSRAILVDTTDGTVLGVYDYPYQVKAAITCSRDRAVLVPMGAMGTPPVIQVIDLLNGNIVATTTLEVVGEYLYYVWSCPPSAMSQN